MKNGLLALVAFLSAVLSAAAADEGDFYGPTSNPEDQMRGIWHVQRNALADFAALGLNTAINPAWSGISTSKDQVDAALVTAERDQFLKVARPLGIDYITMLSKFLWDPDYLNAHRRVTADGKREGGLDVSDPAVFAHMTNMVERFAAVCASGDSAGLVGLMPSSEVRDNSFPSMTKAYKAAWARHSGGKRLPYGAERKTGVGYPYMAECPVSRVIDETCLPAEYWTWFWKEGDGWNAFQTEMARIWNRHFGRRTLTMYDPAVRVPPIWGSGGEVSHLNHWTYVMPEPFVISAITAETEAMARGCPGQRVCQMVQAISYRSKMAPKGVKPAHGPEPEWAKRLPDATYVSTPPDMALEAIWTLFSHRIDGIFFHGWQSILDPERYKAEYRGYRYSNDGLKFAISNAFHAAGIPLGPLFKALPETGDEVVLVESAAATLFAWRGGYGWSDRGACQRASLATLANLSPRVMYEEEIARDGIPADTKVLLMPDCDVLYRKTFDAVRAFQVAGGAVIGDANTVPGILPDGSYPDLRRTQKAAIDTPAFRRAAMDLKETVSGFFRPLADSNRDDVFVRLRRTPGADYLFAINDRRGPGDYVGQWGLIWEKGLPNRATVTVRRADTGAVYDLVRHCPVPFRVADGVTEIDVAYETTDGKALMLVAKPLEPLKAAWGADGLVVTAAERDAMIPIRLAFDTGRTLYGCVRNGRWTPSFAVPADATRVTVTNLADGRDVDVLP